jgi:hypothetical protein
MNTSSITHEFNSLTLLGALLLLACLALVFTPLGNRLKTPQKIKGFGVDLEVSVLTVFVLIGFILSLSTFYMQLRDYEAQLASARSQADTLRQSLAQAQKIEVYAYVSLEGIESVKEAPKLTDIHCSYLPHGQKDWINADVVPGKAPTNYRIILRDITPETNIESMKCADQNPQTPRSWSTGSFYPLTPSYTLKKD